MDIQKILKVLKNERECIKRQVDMTKCKRHEHEGCLKCDLCLPDDEILEVYDFLINGYELLQNEGTESYTIKFKEPLSAVMTDEWGREHFNGICPYTDKKCGHWTCGICEVAERERRFAEGDTE